MSETDDLLPRPPVIRERLAQSLKETRLLRRLLRLSESAAIERHRQAAAAPEPEAPGDRALGRHWECSGPLSDFGKTKPEGVTQ
jgi:hypothetical protein